MIDMNVVNGRTGTRSALGRAGALPARLVGLVLLIVGAVVHVLLIGMFGNVLLDVLFGLSALGLLVGAVLLFVGAPRTGWVVGGGTALLTAVGYVLRSTTGLPGILPQPIPFSVPTSGPVSVVAEVLAVAVAVWALSGGERFSVRTLAAELKGLFGRSG
jgi:hypothetical protein